MVPLLKNAEAAFKRLLAEESREVSRLRTDAESLSDEAKIKPEIEEQRAKKLADAKSLEESVKDAQQFKPSVKGVQVRAMVGREKTKEGGVNLSIHSFGCAIDINAVSNPYVAKREFPASLVKELTGVDVLEGTATRDIRAGGKMSDILPKVTILRRTSDAFKQASRKLFQNRESLKNGLIDYLEKRGAKIRGQVVEENVKEQGARITEEENINKQFDVLFDKIKDAYNEEKAEYSKESKTKYKDKQKEKERKDRLESRKIQHYPNLGSYKALESWIVNYIGVDATKSQEAVNFLLEAYQVFVGSREDTGEMEQQLSKEEQKHDKQGTASGMAIQGFINLPPELITALVSDDGGQLRWLGSTPTVKDYMHFELKKCDLSAPSTKATKTEVAP